MITLDIYYNRSNGRYFLVNSLTQGVLSRRSGKVRWYATPEAALEGRARLVDNFNRILGDLADSFGGQRA